MHRVSNSNPGAAALDAQQTVGDTRLERTSPVRARVLGVVLIALGLGVQACDANTPSAGDEPEPGGGGGSSPVGGSSPSGGTPGPGPGPGPGGSGGSMPMGDAQCADPTPPMPSPAANGTNFPFPQNRQTGCRIPTTGTCLRRLNVDVYEAYLKWVRTFVTATGAGTGLRVRRDEPEGFDTVSEGIAYGMMAAVYMGDRGTFDGLWAYAKAHSRNGLMDWNIDANGAVKANGSNGATDADEDMAWALVMADKQWGAGYLAEARTLINAIWTQEVEKPSYVLKPGNMFGGSSVTNPSYLSPAYYRVFAEVANEPGWLQVVESSYAVLNAAANPQTGLVPDWCTSSGAPAAGRSATYVYDACRTPFRFALDYCLNGEPRALAYLNRVNAFFAPIGPNAIKDGYALNGTATGTKFGPMAFIGPAAVAATADPNGMFTAFADAARASLTTKVRANDGATFSYYNASWGVLSLLVLSGNFVDYRRY